MKQSLEDVLPDERVSIPDGHERQVLSPPVEYLPRGQLPQAALNVLDRYVPGWQGEHSSPRVSKRPGGQVAHALEPKSGAT